MYIIIVYTWQPVVGDDELRVLPLHTCIYLYIDRYIICLAKV